MPIIFINDLILIFSMILSDRDIKKYIREKKLVIKPKPKPEQIQPAWVDLTLGNEFMVFKRTEVPYIDPKNPKDYAEKLRVKNHKPFILHPGEFVLGTVREYIKFPSDLAGAVDGRSSLGRLGILTHITSTFINPGWEGRLVLEINNIGKMPVALYPGMRVCKVVFFKLSSPCETPYYAREDAKYQAQKGVEASKLEKEFY